MLKLKYPINRFLKISLNNNNSLIVQSCFKLQTNKCLSTTPNSVKTEFGKVQFNSRNKNNKKITSLGWFLLLVPITTFSLGCWQVQRKKWKEGLIAELFNKTHAEPVFLPDDLTDLEAMEYRPVKVRGRFIHSKEVFIGPRSFMEHGSQTSNSGLFSSGNKGIGFHVITPFKIEGREDIILINRGWIPKNSRNQTTRLSGQVEGIVELTGVVRLNEKRPQFSPECTGDHFLYRNLPKICSATGAQPFFLDARYESTINGGPIGGQTRINLTNDHFSYLVTWFSLSAFTSFMWYKTFLKGFKF